MYVMQDAEIDAALLIDQGLEVISIDGVKVVGVCHHCGLAVTENEKLLHDDSGQVWHQKDCVNG